MRTNFIPKELTSVSGIFVEAAIAIVFDILNPVTRQIIAIDKHFLFAITLPFGGYVAVRFDKLTDLRPDIELFNVCHFCDRCCTQGRDLG